MSGSYLYFTELKIMKTDCNMKRKLKTDLFRSHCAPCGPVVAPVTALQAGYHMSPARSSVGARLAHMTTPAVWPTLWGLLL